MNVFLGCIIGVVKYHSTTNSKALKYRLEK